MHRANHHPVTGRRITIVAIWGVAAAVVAGVVYGLNQPPSYRDSLPAPIRTIPVASQSTISLIPGVKVGIQSTMGSTADGNLKLAPASVADRPKVTPASIIAMCKTLGCTTLGTPSDITLARVSGTLPGLQNLLAWVVEWDVPGDKCPPPLGGPMPRPGQPTPARYVATSCTWWQVVDANSGATYGAWSVG
jgi:hypothetical protein